MWPNQRSRFKLTGGRSGFIEFVDGGRTGRLEWEMLMGDAHMGLFADHCRWIESDEPIATSELEAFVQELATDSGMNVLLTFPDGEKVVRP